MPSSLLHLDGDGRLADTACWRRCHASIKSRQTSPAGDERQNTRKSGSSPADNLKGSQLAAGREPPFSVGRHRRGESQQQASKRQSAAEAPECRSLLGLAENEKRVRIDAV